MDAHRPILRKGVCNDSANDSDGLSVTYFLEVMQTFGARDVSRISPYNDMFQEEDPALERSPKGRTWFPHAKLRTSYRIERATRNSLRFSAVGSITGCNRLALLIESFLQYEQHYFRYTKMTYKEKANSPEDICADMQPLREKRAIIMGDVKEFETSHDDWRNTDEFNASLRRMPLIDEPLAVCLSKYCDELSCDDLGKSPYKDRSRTLHMLRLLSDCQKDIADGKMQIYEITGNALVNIEKNLQCLPKCTISDDESKKCEWLRKGLLDYAGHLIVNEACRQAILTPGTITDVSEQVPQRKKSTGELNSRSRRKMRIQRRKGAKTSGRPLDYDVGDN